MSKRGRPPAVETEHTAVAASKSDTGTEVLFQFKFFGKTKKDHIPKILGHFNENPEDKEKFKVGNAVIHIFNEVGTYTADDIK